MDNEQDRRSTDVQLGIVSTKVDLVLDAVKQHSSDTKDSFSKVHDRINDQAIAIESLKPLKDLPEKVQKNTDAITVARAVGKMGHLIWVGIASLISAIAAILGMKYGK